MIAPFLSRTFARFSRLLSRCVAMTTHPRCRCCPIFSSHRRPHSFHHCPTRLLSPKFPGPTPWAPSSSRKLKCIHRICTGLTYVVRQQRLLNDNCASIGTPAQARPNWRAGANYVAESMTNREGDNSVFSLEAQCGAWHCPCNSPHSSRICVQAYIRALDNHRRREFAPPPPSPTILQASPKPPPPPPARDGGLARKEEVPSSKAPTTNGSQQGGGRCRPNALGQPSAGVSSADPPTPLDPSPPPPRRPPPTSSSTACPPCL